MFLGLGIIHQSTKNRIKLVISNWKNFQKKKIAKKLIQMNVNNNWYQNKRSRKYEFITIVMFIIN